MEEKIKHRLFCFLFIILIAPLVQHKVQLITSGKLQGGYKDAEDTTFSIEGWNDGSYQKKKEQYLNDQTGFRPDLVRITNQIDYSLLDKCHAGWTVKGKDQFLYQFPYIRAYYGRDFLGPVAILDRSLKLKALQDTLARLGKSLILAYLPSKASFYPEHFADRSVEVQGPTNHDTYRHYCDSLGVNQVDLDSWFVAIKHTTKEKLFSKQGIHWTYYGAILGGDSLTRYIERLRHLRVAHPIWSQMEHTSKLREGDDDLVHDLNLIFPVTTETLAYPIVKEVPDSGLKKINGIYIGDSYAQKMIDNGIIHLMNDQCEFWGYFKEMHDINHHTYSVMQDYDWLGAIGRADCVVLAYTSFNFCDLGNGFIDLAYKHYYPHGPLLTAN